MGRKSVPWEQEDQGLSQKRETADGAGIPVHPATREMVLEMDPSIG